MPTDHILDLLIEERNRLNRAIEALQTPTRRGGGLPKTASATTPANGAAPRRRGMSAAARKAQSERM